MIITIGREFGSCGHIIGKKLSERLGIKYYDKDSLAEEARKSEQYEEIRAFYEEQPVNSLLYVIALDSGRGRESKVPFEFIRQLAEKEDCIIVGRCGNHILKDNPDMTSVFIHAPLEYRIKKTAEDRNISISKAERLVEKEDKARIGFHKYYADEVWNCVDNYQLTIDSSAVGIDGAVDMIIDFVDKKQAVKGK